MARRLALIIGNSIFRDPSLARLLSPDSDVGALADVLLNPEIGAFDDVKLVVNMAAASIRRAISQFFANKTRDDLLLLYFSGHGVLDENGRLYLATKETERSYLRGTAIPASFVTDEMDHSRSRRQVLVLDCCHSGAFARGTKGAPGASVGTATAFEGKGYGRVVLTASDATQYAWEGDQVIGEAENSLFTHYLVQGLQTGQADTDADGTITVDELYDYIYSHVISQTPNQTPGKWSYKEQGEIILARAAAGGAPPPEQIDLPEFDDEIEAKLKRLYDTGLAAYWLDDWDRAARAFQAILDARPDYPGALDKLREARRNAELTGLYQTAQDALSSQDWRAAVSTLEALLAQAPDYRDAASQLKSAQQQAHLTDLYAEARRVLASIDEIDPDYPDPHDLQAAIDENIAALERRKKLEDLYSQALAKIDAGSREDARDLLSQIQELEPGYAETKPLLAKVESLLQRQAEERQRQEVVGPVSRQAIRVPLAKQRQPFSREIDQPGPSSKLAAQTWPSLQQRSNLALREIFTLKALGLYSGWMIASTVGLAGGFAFNSILGLPVSSALFLPIYGPESLAFPAPDYSLLIWILNGAIPGAALGLLQWFVIKRRLLHSSGWVLASILGLAVSSVLLIGGAEAGWLVGLLVGGSQWLVFRGRITGSGWWVPASMLAWGVGLSAAAFPVWVSIGAVESSADSGAIIGAIAGSVIGALTGPVLIWLLRHDIPEAK